MFSEVLGYGREAWVGGVSWKGGGGVAKKEGAWKGDK